MTDRQDIQESKALDWLLEPANPNARYLALRDLLDTPLDDPELLAAEQAAYSHKPMAAILEAAQPEGYWARPGPGYTKKYRSTVWALITLSQLGASVGQDARIARGCAYLLDNALAEGGRFSYNTEASGTIDCLQGNLCAALLELGYDDPRLEAAFDWMARSVTGENPASDGEPAGGMYFQKGNVGPLFACSYNGSQPCAYGGVKEMLAFSKLPPGRRTPPIERAMQAGIDFLFSSDPALALYPTKDGARPNRSWWKFGFPVFYITDLLQIVEVLVELGFGQDPRLEHALELIRSKQDEQGRWNLEHSYPGRTWGSFGTINQPNKWVTLRALRVLKAVDD